MKSLGEPDLIDQIFSMKDQCSLCMQMSVTLFYKLTKKSFRVEANHLCKKMNANIRLTKKYNISKFSESEWNALREKILWS